MADRVYIFDTTLRDGEQSPGCSMTVPEKLRMAAKMVELGLAYTSHNGKARPQQAQSAGFRNNRLAPAATASDDVVIQRHRAIHRQGAAAADARAGSQGNASIRENISFERRPCTQSRGAANLPEYVGVRARLSG